MSQRYSRVKRAEEYNRALDNYINYLRQLDNRPNKRLQGGTVGQRKPRVEVAVLPFGRTSDEKVLTSITKASQTKIGSAIGGRITTNLTGVIVIKRFVPTKVHYFEPTSDDARSYRQSKTTGLFYLHQEGDSYSGPFGATVGTEEEEAGSRAVKNAVLALAPSKETRKVYISPEKIPI